uniref:glutaminase n=1 Tax=viral metagenome TaxID=1070528 RepID=A0A6C0J0R6_9ZZZZ
MDFEELSGLGIHKHDLRFKDNIENNAFIDKYNKGLLEVTNFKDLKNIIEEIYNVVKPNNQGDVADYIPQLKNVNDELFGITLTTVDGQVIEVGDIKQKFCIQSCSKPISYGIALEKYNKDTVHNYVGKEPSGRNFNELCLDHEGLPHNPLINSGAIMTTSLLSNDKPISERFEEVYNYWKRLVCGTYLSFNNSVYLSEKDSADRNYCLGYMMQENESFLGKDKTISNKINRKWGINDLKTNLELYFQFCSIELDLLGVGLVASTLANGGVHPWSHDIIFSGNSVKNILSIMSSCGMYDYSGEWNYEIGIPAKSGVSGIIYAVIPGLCGIAVYSPKLDKNGNSFRGIEFFKMLSKKIKIHKYEDIKSDNLLSIRRNDFNNIKILGFLLLDGCHSNNFDIVKECISKGCDINFTDYDSRTGLHLAIEENHLQLKDFLIENGADQDIKDRWGISPRDLLKKK